MAAKKETAVDVLGEFDPLEPVLSNAELNAVGTTQEELLALFTEWGMDESDLIIGDAYPLADKDDLVGVPLALIQWRFGISQNFLGEYVQIRAVRLDTNERVGIFDSGVGLYGTLKTITDERIENGSVKPPYNGAMVKGGLTRSDYPAKTMDDGSVRPAGTTYYFA